MAHVSRSKAALRIGGDTLDPAEISNTLGCQGTTMYSKGDLRHTKSGREIERKHGLWLLASDPCEPEDIDGQVRDILSKLSDDLAVWDKLISEYSIDLFCGIFLEESNEGMKISAEMLSELGKRHIMIGLDIYDGSQ